MFEVLVLVDVVVAVVVLFAVVTVAVVQLSVECSSGMLVGPLSANSQ